MTRKATETHTIQVWPGGQSYTYRGDVDGPANQRSLKDVNYNSREVPRWRKGTREEWRAIRIEVRAEMYWAREGMGCDSALVSDLLQLENYVLSTRGDGAGSELARAFGVEEIRNLYADPSDWDAGQCRAYANDNGIALPDLLPCKVHGRDQTGPQPQTCPDCSQEQDEQETDDGRSGWLTEAREVCREHAQDHPAEVYEWWRVSAWLCDQLHAIGEVTIDNGYGHWWGRTCTGQSLLMDGTLQRVAAQFERERD